MNKLKKEINVAATRIDELEKTINEMFAADTEYGSGFYNHEPWRVAYAKLQKMVMYKGNTTVFDPLCDDIEDLQ